jgi:hypothetical protein
MIMQPPIGRIMLAPAETLKHAWRRVCRAATCGWGWLRYYSWYRWHAKMTLAAYEEVARRRDARRGLY